MKKVLAIVIGLFLLASVASVFAHSEQQTKSFATDIVQKNPDDWSVIEGGYSGKVYAYQQVSYEKKVVKVTVTREHWDGRIETKTYNEYEKIPITTDYIGASFKGLPGEKYTLIYYGDETNNDVWPYATCIAEAKEKISRHDKGRFEVKSTKYAWTPFLDNGKEEKFWVVPSSDVDCGLNQMTVWDPKDILFEMKTL